ncbi:MAG: Glycine--tRNA ligase beta subunit [Syntrophaceae bacterium PtaU1.Bin231]|nr:MAG: Glycine--tRNA ligase beta subunit [Syntrophaceae bacterium PtaU1.Bin231]HOG17585.1 glycine--tRNA ligase subunit beta [Syntrophales bacterium]
MGKELLLEIGTEEIPAGFLPKACRDMDEMIRREFATARIAHGQVRTMATPRRLVLYVEGVAERQEDQVIEKMGPARKVAYDDKGNPTKAALGFARGQGIDLCDMETIRTDKGEYLFARKRIPGGRTADLLPDLLARFIPAIPFRKSMRWSDLSLRFARPIHWILALFGGEVVPFRLETLASGDTSRGHRFMAPEAFAVKDFADYLVKTREHFVVVDPEERKRTILEEAQKAAQAVGGSILRNEDLLETVTFLVEYPSAVCGSFDREFLELPKEVLITSMMSHQKYFPVGDAAGNLLPHFVTINNTLARDPSVVARGNEKVIRARLSDARFFFTEDRKIPLERRVDDLNKVVFHSLLGTSREKVERFRKLAAWIARRLKPELADSVDRAAFLAKADLDTQMVGEFAELQGVMGREYALLAGEQPAVARAIYEHYLPTAAGGALPQTDEGAIVGIADKTDTIVGFFGVNVVPTGTADPYALRRQALGIINIILDRGYDLRLDFLIDESLAILAGKTKRKPAEVRSDVLEFFRGRFDNQLVSQGHPYDVVDAVLATDPADLVRSLRKIEAMEVLKSQPDFEPLATSFKRIGNIIKGFCGGDVKPELFAAPQERELYAAYLAVSRRAQDHIDRDDFAAALKEMATLRKPVDAFFDAVMVMVDDRQICFNRQSLLAAISILFRSVADFSKLATETV